MDRLRGEAGRRTLASATGPLSLRLVLDCTDLTANGQDLAHVLVEVVDASGTVDMVGNELITAFLTGPVTRGPRQRSPGASGSLLG